MISVINYFFINIVLKNCVHSVDIKINFHAIYCIILIALLYNFLVIIYIDTIYIIESRMSIVLNITH